MCVRRAQKQPTSFVAAFRLEAVWCGLLLQCTKALIAWLQRYSHIAVANRLRSGGWAGARSGRVLQGSPFLPPQVLLCAVWLTPALGSAPIMRRDSTQSVVASCELAALREVRPMVQSHR